MLPEKISIIGSGNVATRMGVAIKNAGFDICSVFSRNPAKANELAEKLGSRAILSLENLPDSDLVIIAVSDDIVEDIARQLTGNKLIVHTSGSLDIQILQNATDNFGVLYPLQTLSKTREAEFQNIPVLIEGSNKSTLDLLNKFATKLSEKVLTVDSEKRKKIHLAAVFASNFTNHMYHIASDILQKENIPMDILHPLIIETAEKLKVSSPGDAQTGPARRNDVNILHTHMRLLDGNTYYQQLYEMISEGIFKKLKNT